MNNEQLYKRQNGNYKEVYPNTLLSSILDKESGKTLKDIISAYNHLYVPFVNNIYETLTAVPVFIRRKGLWVTWETEDSINTYQFNLSTAEASDDAIWGNIESWEQVPDLGYYNTHAAVPDGSITLNKLSDEVRQWLVNAGKIINYPDREDITEKLGLLRFADRQATPGVSSMGYKILRRDKSFVEQVIEENTIYEIKYDFTLDENVNIPNNCVLKFNGGSISGNINFNKTLLDGTPKIDGRVYGSLINNVIDVTWFGIIGNDLSDNGRKIQDLLNIIKVKSNTLFFPAGIYRTTMQLDFYGGTIKGASMSYTTVENQTVIKSSAPENILVARKHNDFPYATRIIEDIGICGNDINNGLYCLARVFATRVNCMNCQVGLVLYETYNAVFNECIFNNNQHEGVIIEKEGNNILFIGCNIGGNCKQIDAYYPCINIKGNSSRISFIGCEFYPPVSQNASIMIAENCFNITIRECYSEQYKQPIFIFQNTCDCVNIENNFFLDTFVYCTIKHGKISGNTFKLKNQQLGSIYFDIDNDSIVDNNYIDDGYAFTVNKVNISRPTKGLYKGMQHFDLSGKPIWWNGTAWIDATGTEV